MIKTQKKTEPRAALAKTRHQAFYAAGKSEFAVGFFSCTPTELNLVLVVEAHWLGVSWRSNWLEIKTYFLCQRSRGILVKKIPLLGHEDTDGSQ